MEDYRRAYNDAWMIAWLSASSNTGLTRNEVAMQTRAVAHSIASDFADVQQQFRH